MKKSIVFILVCLFLSGMLSASERPRIGITCSFSQEKIQLNHDYIKAVVDNGGIPVMLPPTLEDEVIAGYVEMIDGAVFTGGYDIPPEYYGQKQHFTTKVMDSLRFGFEQKFVKAFLDSGKPTLGICLGMQMANVVSGGTMYQDIPSLIGKKVCHRNGEMYTNFHAVGISRFSMLEKALGTTSTRVISRHHQAVDKVGKNLAVSARSSDGIIEALERNDGHFGLFVQWHPESMQYADSNHTSRLFAALIRAASRKR